MPKHVSKLTCEVFQSYIADQINSGLDREDSARHPHAEGCERCRQLLRDLEEIGEAARSLFPEEWKERIN